MITKEQLDKYFVAQREAQNLFAPIIAEAWAIGHELETGGYRLKIGPLVGAHSITFRYYNEYTKKSFVVEAPVQIIYRDPIVMEERKKFVEEMVKSLR